MENQEYVKASLILEDGAEFSGFSFGAPQASAGEVVFTTSMTGYPQSLTDPSFRGQILVSTYPMIGNYGVPLTPQGEPFYDEYGVPLHFESSRIQVAGFVVCENCDAPSHHSSSAGISWWLKHCKISGVCGVDTRAVAKLLREKGVMRGKIIIDGLENYEGDGIIHHPVSQVSCKEVMRYSPRAEGPHPKIVLIDCGAKANILRTLIKLGAGVTRVPWDYNIENLEYDGLFLSNGPGDPKSCGKTIASMRQAFLRGKPVFGICLGAQIMALAAGADTYKLPYGHRAANQPCIESGSGRCYITSQNHGYAVRAETLPKDWEVWFTNANDGTVEGVRAKNAPFSAVQFHPEGCPGPRDSEFLIERFIKEAAAHSCG
ncbi:MAG: glutamine-hydrolyzing carbamoyl-phosphate synthase small subunit [Spirochaetaceae bacterium]|jgi:carbamoyl-phosphate synthase small subunit|nr:glutamine-hydrolyzing carbamoyl-phosphate synthase small subunit [Spirochaetaceae bacterium]